MSGNIFKGQTQRIYKKDVDTTLEWLECHLNLELIKYKIGSTGIKEISGDLDVVVWDKIITKDELVEKLIYLIPNSKPEWVKKSGIGVHFKTPINGDERNGFVQTDFMVGDREFIKFSHSYSSKSKFSGFQRMMLMASIAKAKGFKWSPTRGLVNRETNKIITKDPKDIAIILLGPNTTPKDLDSVEKIFRIINTGDIHYVLELIADAKKHINFDKLW